MSVFMMLQVKADPSRLREVMAEAGVTSRPEITFRHPVDTPDSF